jgi:hypothetical protein
MRAQERPADDDLWESAPIRRCVVPNAERLNCQVLAAFRALRPDDFHRRSHLIGGRYENLYLERSRIPVLEPILVHAQACAGRILGRSPESLRCGFWFNAMGPSQSTSEHTHDEHDELLAAVYYVEAPEGSGDLVLYDGPLIVRTSPLPGTLVFFPPDLAHAVEPNRSGRPRLSIGINFGPLSPT